MYLVHTFKNNFQNAEEKKKVWETISIFESFFFKKQFTKVTRRICKLLLIFG